ncbi:hypothetical protein MITS9509_03101 [Synechococcus sp. MIT S9509]|nr:hypothetical protein MITS9504_03174 [Synechococcus sp. MIT S9504]KZR89032.1 hypothetical protein MITS9509_03101 [Synechococcus sp. MIT S9509]
MTAALGCDSMLAFEGEVLGRLWAVWKASLEKEVEAIMSSQWMAVL